ncbi:LOW QUALITY PROTEIN: hypothetical protein PHMEG_0006462 [Phytophthora megakarya]|uniref:HTH CENPB-type domain-containing protein n=1 Tax=Phytophthora megakarya TaxID=4795 RepID=A0A225WNR9_9STRA|nr:LOW QUALITY PROTEIN: hypothetical protein PHMEG_0006462 [Phytophthora megakarya]
MRRGRKRAPGGRSRHPSAYNRACDTFGKKLDVINFHLEHGMKATLENHLAHTSLDSKRKQISEWQNDREKIEFMASTTAGTQKKSARKKGTSTTISTKREKEAIVEWVKLLGEEGVPMSGLMLKLRAQGVANAESVAGGVSKRSWVWQKSFLGRYGLSWRAETRQGPKPPAKLEQEALEFCVKEIQRKLGVTKIYITPTKYLPKRTVSEKGVKTVWVRCGGKGKERFTGIFRVDSEDDQYPPFFMKPKHRLTEQLQHLTPLCRMALAQHFGKI